MRKIISFILAVITFLLIGCIYHPQVWRNSDGTLLPKSIKFDCDQKCGRYDQHQTNDLLIASCETDCYNSRGYFVVEGGTFSVVTENREPENTVNAPKAPPAIIQKNAVNEKLKFGAFFVKNVPASAKILGMDEPKGVLITSIVQDSVAYKSGFRQGDVILKYDLKTVTENSDLQGAIAATAPGSTIPITVWRVRRGEMVITAQFP